MSDIEMKLQMINLQLAKAFESERTAHDTTKWKVKQLEAKLELFSASKDKLIKAIEKLIEKKDPSCEEREIWALEEALDIINSKLPE